MAKHIDEKHLIDTERLFKISGLNEMSTLRTYVGTYKIFVPVASAPNDRREYRYDQRCCEIRIELLKLFVPRSGPTMKDFCEWVNEVCGERDEILLQRLNAGAVQEALREEKEKELLEKLGIKSE